jgi:hypothetical protein
MKKTQEAEGRLLDDVSPPLAEPDLLKRVIWLLELILSELRAANSRLERIAKWVERCEKSGF